MGTVIAFLTRRTARPVAAIEAGHSAEVTILPVVRIERAAPALPAEPLLPSRPGNPDRLVN